MEFERAIFRVYERCVEGLRDEDSDEINSKSCRIIEITVLCMATFFLGCLIFLHLSFVGHAGCLPRLLAIKNITTLKDDAIIQLHIDKYLDNDLFQGLSVSEELDDNIIRRQRFRRVLLPSLHNYLSQYTSSSTSLASSLKNNDNHQQKTDGIKMKNWIPFTIPHTHTHHIKKLHFTRYLYTYTIYLHSWLTNRQSSSYSHTILRSLQNFNMSNNDSTTTNNTTTTISTMSPSIITYDGDITTDNNISIVTNTTIDIMNITNNSTTTTNSTNTTDILIMTDDDDDEEDDSPPDYDYEFTFNVGELILPKHIRKQHNFDIINISMSSSQCFGNLAARYLLPLGGIDTVIINNFMHTFHKDGHLLSAAGDYYRWDKEDTYIHKSIEEWIGFKCLIILSSIFAFFVLSTATALLVRVLISSGVVLLLPIFSLFQLCGMRLITNQIIRLSYPWIGVPLEMLRTRNQSIVPFIIAHITRVIIYYLFYEACQLTFSSWFYSQEDPGQRELWLFAIMMLWEYYSMIYVRSKHSIQLFPRAIFALFLIYHFYLYSQPYGFHILALLVMFLYSLYVMVYCVRNYELVVFYRGIVNIDRPRMMYNVVTWPTWSMALAPDFTIFLPLSEESTDIYTQPVPPTRPEGTPATAENRSQHQESTMGMNSNTTTTTTHGGQSADSSSTTMGGPLSSSNSDNYLQDMSDEETGHRRSIHTIQSNLDTLDTQQSTRIPVRTQLQMSSHTTTTTTRNITNNSTTTNSRLSTAGEYHVLSGDDEIYETNDRNR